MQIFYLCPDLSFPSGGIRRLYKHVQLLIENGFTAHILHFKKGFKPNWFQSNVPVQYLDDYPSINLGDVIVVPEGFPNVMKKFESVDLHKVAITLNPLYPFQSLPPGESWKDYGFETVLASSKQLADLISWSMGISDIYVFKTSIDQEVFNYDPSKKRNQIAYVGRKDLNTSIIEKMLKLRQTYSTQFQFIKIDNLKFEDYSEVLRRSAIYLSTSAYEGTNRSILEAMACGCLCAGYHGLGGRDYLIPEGEDQNFIQAETLDFFQLAQLIDQLMLDYINEEFRIDIIRRNGLKTASGFHEGLERDSILEFWTSMSQGLIINQGNSMYVKKAHLIDKEIVAAGEKTFKQVLIDEKQGHHFSMRLFTIEKDGSMPNHANTVEHEQYVVNGKARISIDDEEYDVETGDVVYIPAGIPHWYKNTGNSDFQFLCLIPNQEDKITLIV